MKRLGVNIDHVATVRNARGEIHPDPYKAALFVKKKGADSITIHLREDRRHIKDLDAKKICSIKKLLVNLEISTNNDIVKNALRIKPKFICKIPKISTLEDFDEKSLIKILQEPKNSLTKQYQELFKLDGAKLTFKENALKEIAQKAISKKTGARGLRSILENILLKTMYDLPSQDNIEEVIVDAGAAKGQSQPILVHAKGDGKTKSNKTTAA